MVNGVPSSIASTDTTLLSMASYQALTFRHEPFTMNVPAMIHALLALASINVRGTQLDSFSISDIETLAPNFTVTVSSSALQKNELLRLVYEEVPVGMSYSRRDPAI
ncbi:MAG: hypothetical protein M1820_004601 [Bogoriella megaspora]|nr:MAG: hypothetical protein M1820_004601 [Bogoriella megaspora]